MEDKKKVLIGSPINQKPEVLKQFLASLKEVKKDTIHVDYLFVDDNESEESSKLLQSFKCESSEVIVYEDKKMHQYIRNETTHHWNEELIWKVAGFKNMIIQIAIEYNYDYLFFIDSDLVIHPSTIEHLVSTNKDIISEIFWTSWQPEIQKLPQVWLTDQYTLYSKRREESLTEQQAHQRQFDFLNQLRKPGIYEVGGLGACTLISRKALVSGVNFSEIKNVSFWGEDRHFCIRAVALGFSLFVDTHHPAYHIYRDSDLDGVEVYKQRNEVKSIRKKPKLTLSMVIKNEADRYLRQALESHKHYVDEAVIIDDGSTDNSIEICREVLRGIPIHIIQNKESKFSNEIELRRQQWEETIKTNPDWILNLDADEVFEQKFQDEVQYLINQHEYNVICFRLYDFWDDNHYREDEYWKAHLFYRPFLMQYNENFIYKWKESAQHCGRFPENILELSLGYSSMRLKHYGWVNPVDRLAKYERYRKLDPEAKYGWKEQYDSILDENPNLVEWEEMVVNLEIKS